MGLVGLRTYGPCQRQPDLRARFESPLDPLGDRLSDVGLQGEDLDEVTVVRLGPDLHLVLDADQLRGDADVRALSADAAIDDISHVEIPPDLVDSLVRSRVLAHRAASDDAEAVRVEAPDDRDELLVQAFGEVGLRRVLAEILEREDGHRHRTGRPDEPPPEKRTRRECGRRGAEASKDPAPGLERSRPPKVRELLLNLGGRLISQRRVLLEAFHDHVLERGRNLTIRGRGRLRLARLDLLQHLIRGVASGRPEAGRHL